MPRAAGRGQPAVTVTGPGDGKFFYPVALFPGADDNFYIERKTVCDALAVQVPRNVTLVYLKSALCIGKLGRNFHISNDKPVEHFGAEPPV